MRAEIHQRKESVKRVSWPSQEKIILKGASIYPLYDNFKKTPEIQDLGESGINTTFASRQKGKVLEASCNV